MTKANKQPEPQGTIQVRLLKPHTHAGVNYPAGETLDVPSGTADWLAKAGVIESDKGDAK
jgi:hypothetical protein